MTLFRTLTKNGLKDFYDFLYGVRGGDCLTFCENRMSKKLLVLELWPGTFRWRNRWPIKYFAETGKRRHLWCSFWVLYKCLYVTWSLQLELHCCTNSERVCCYAYNKRLLVATLITRYYAIHIRSPSSPVQHNTTQHITNSSTSLKISPLQGHCDMCTHLGSNVCCCLLCVCVCVLCVWQPLRHLIFEWMTCSIFQSWISRERLDRF